MVEFFIELQFAIAMFPIFGLLFGILVTGMKRTKAIPFILLGIAINVIFMLVTIFQSNFQDAYRNSTALFYLGILGSLLAAIVRAVTSKSSRSR